MAKTATKRKARPAAKCKHNLCDAIIGGTRVIAYRCWRCSALGVRSLGPSDDEPEAVRVEMRAAEIDAEGGILAVANATESEWLDWYGHPLSPVGTGWLARELDTHDSRETRDASAWPWDQARPIAGQWEEWQATRSLSALRALTASVTNDAPRADLGSPPDDFDPFTTPGPAGDFGGPHGKWPAAAPDAFDDEAFDVSDVPPDEEQR